jgi:hemerythrin
MDKISWDASFSVGVEKLDEQHQRIIGMINLMLSDPEAAVDSETTSEALTRMTQYANEHFKVEEQLMEDHEYPDLAAHKLEHKAFRKSTAMLCVDTMQKYADVPDDILKYLKDWWTRHILITDMKYRSFFNERGVK